MGWARGGEYYISKPRMVEWKDIRPWRPEGKHFVSGNSLIFYSVGMKKKLRWAGGGRAAPRLACY